METVQKKGTKEWSSKSHNVCIGCKNNCSYCYAKSDANRFTDKKVDDWKNMTFKEKIVELPYVHGKVLMFPTAHDIFPENVDLIIKETLKALNKGWRVLLVTKAIYSCIHKIINTIPQGYWHRIELRVTIDHYTDSDHDLFEPSASSYEERLKALKFAAEKGFNCSVSCEPCLMCAFQFKFLISDISNPNVKIWLGLMNKPGRNMLNQEQKERLGKIESKDNLKALFKIAQESNNRIILKETFARIIPTLSDLVEDQVAEELDSELGAIETEEYLEDEEGLIIEDTPTIKLTPDELVTFVTSPTVPVLPTEKLKKKSKKAKVSEGVEN